MDPKNHRASKDPELGARVERFLAEVFRRIGHTAKV